MKKDLDGFWGRLPPEAQRLVESLDQRQGRRLEARQAQAGGVGFSSFERMIMGEEAEQEMEVQEDDRMFEPPARDPAREPAPAPKGRRSMRSLIESMERK